jgi:hypothetical protein
MLAAPPRSALALALTPGSGWRREGLCAPGGARGERRSRGRCGVVTTDATALQRAPRFFSRVIATTPAGDTVNVLHCGSRLGSGWSKVACGGAVGYVRGGPLARNVYQ